MEDQVGVRVGVVLVPVGGQDGRAKMLFAVSAHVSGFMGEHLRVRGEQISLHLSLVGQARETQLLSGSAGSEAACAGCDVTVALGPGGLAAAAGRRRSCRGMRWL